MKLIEYQIISKRTMPAVYDEKAKANYAMGLSGEAGEVTDLIKKELFHGHNIDPVDVKKELGDVLHYLSGLATMYGWTLEEVANTNIEKLSKRYPFGFSKEASVNRNE
ncbi:nucleoside triphosphate pyrophosphohydrolase family protein [Heyndrickxia oleronia]|uniref:nucleoside triphosphate pyrophosphohydrolase family protein n=1 Tax=Heyndrickxia oleronia TaxID=38875 RepID=UPI001C0F0667|nr:nucleoside triphosphate pyrophosphohydrolase family protein [Heyndrickxia oleronia]MBU5214379.1 nucleoside triphosphate pyrophosphohydrolase family protein [Heyndrickxia oleronia]